MSKKLKRAIGYTMLVLLFGSLFFIEASRVGFFTTAVVYMAVLLVILFIGYAVYLMSAE